MARRIFPSSGDRLAYAIVGSDLRAQVGSTVTVYTDVTASVLADIQTLAGGAVPGSVLTIGADSQLPRFLGPADGADTLYVRSAGGTGDATRITSEFDASDVSMGVINVKDHGATGDGATDDTAAIQAALSAVGSTGGVVHFPTPASVYLVSAPLLVSIRGTKLRGDGIDRTLPSVNGSVIKTSPSFVGNEVVLFSAPECGMHDLTVYNNLLAKFAVRTTAERLYVSTCRIVGAWGDGSAALALENHKFEIHDSFIDAGGFITTGGPNGDRDGDANIIFGVTHTSGSATLTKGVSSRDFTAGDVGKVVEIMHGGGLGKTYRTTVAAFVSASQITLAANMENTSTGGGVLRFADEVAGSGIIVGVITNGYVDTTQGAANDGNITGCQAEGVDKVGIWLARGGGTILRGNHITTHTGGDNCIRVETSQAVISANYLDSAGASLIDIGRRSTTTDTSVNEISIVGNRLFQNAPANTQCPAIRVATHSSSQGPELKNVNAHLITVVGNTVEGFTTSQRIPQMFSMGPNPTKCKHPIVIGNQAWKCSALYGSGKPTISYGNALDVSSVNGDSALPDTMRFLTKTSALVDGDFADATDGIVGVDTTNSRLYVRIGGVWKSVVLA